MTLGLNLPHNYYLGATVKELLKSTLVCQRWHKNKSGSIFMAPRVYVSKFAESIAPVNASGWAL